jgi:dolichol-phosphate mannosyltransferase
MKKIVVIPTYNEIENIPEIVEKIHSNVDDLDILIVDDNSPDGTADLVEEMMETDKRINIMKRPGKMGLGTAYCDGFAWCLEQGYELIMQMDADLSHDPADLPRFIDEIKDYDLIIGSRYASGINVVNWPLSRLILSYSANIYTRIITGMPISDATGGFKCFRAEALSQVDLKSIKSNGYGFQIEMNYSLWKNKSRIKEIPIIFIDRRSGVSKMSKKIIWEAAFLVWQLKFGRKHKQSRRLSK